jgi:hypothetical protein
LGESRVGFLEVSNLTLADMRDHSPERGLIPKRVPLPFKLRIQLSTRKKLMQSIETGNKATTDRVHLAICPTELNER